MERLRGEYRFPKDTYDRLCHMAFCGCADQIEEFLQKMHPKDRARIGRTTLCPPLRYEVKGFLVNSATSGQIKTVRYFIEDHADITDINEVSCMPEIVLLKMYPLTPLIGACISEQRHRRGGFEVVQYLVKKGAEINKAPTAHRKPALAHAVKLKTIKFLVDSGADLNQCDLEGLSPFYHFIVKESINIKDKVEILDYALHKRPNVYLRTEKGHTAMHLAHDQADILRLFFKRKLSPLFDQGNEDVNAFDYVPCPAYIAAYDNEDDAVVAFLERKDIPLECKINVYLLQAAGRIAFYNSDSDRKQCYGNWVQGLELIEKYNVSLPYPQPLEAYGYRREVRTKEELEAVHRGGKLELWFQYILIYERCLGREGLIKILEVAQKMNENKYFDAGHAVIERALSAEERALEMMLASPPGTFYYHRYVLTRDIVSFFHILSLNMEIQGFPRCIEFGLLALKVKYHLGKPVDDRDKRQIFRLFSIWMELCRRRFLPYPPALFYLAQRFISMFLYYPENSLMLLRYCNYYYTHPELLRMLMDAGGDVAINDIGEDGTTILGKTLEEAIIIRNAKLGYRFDEVIMVLLECGAHIDMTTSLGLNIFCDVVKERVAGYHSIVSKHLPLSLCCLSANAIADYGLPYHMLPPRVIKFIGLHDPAYFKANYEYFP